ncbi:MAG TPA: hypothetical protein VGK70_12490 [Thermoanaerobaculia bacterium]|jgi:hypothetical protein
MKSAPVSEVEERLAALEQKLEEFSLALRGLERRMASLPSGVPEPEPESVSDAAEPVLSTLSEQLPQQGAVLNVLTELGRSCLILGGAFLVRALTDSGTLQRPVGAGLGLAYGVLWVLLADRSAAHGRSTSATFLGITSVVIAYPLVVETSTRMAVFRPSGAAAILAALTLLCLGVAWHRGLALFAWAALGAAVASSFVLGIVTGAVEPFAAALLAIGVASLWLAYSPRPWRGLRWPAAAAADVFVLWSALRLAPSGPPAPESTPSLSFFLVLAFALPFLYLGSFAVRTLARRRNVVLFDAVQGIAALAVGFGGAALVVRYVQDAQPILGASAVVIGVGCYGVAFVFVERQQRRNFLFYATLALLLTLSGSALLAGGGVLTLLWCLLAVASAILATRFTRVTLAVHSAAYALAAAWRSGSAGASLDAFVAPPARPWTPLTAAGLCAIGAAAACYVLLAREKGEANRARERFPRLMLAVTVAFGGGAFAIVAIKNLIGGGPASLDSAAIAAARTAVLAVAVFLLAAARRRAALPELAWLTYGVLSIGAVKLLIEDLPGGRPATLFVAFLFYGAALLAAPRLLRRAPSNP